MFLVFRFALQGETKNEEQKEEKYRCEPPIAYYRVSPVRFLIIPAAVEGEHVGHQIIDLLSCERLRVVAVHDAFLVAAG